jgi:hypothetical protein
VEPRRGPGIEHLTKQHSVKAMSPFYPSERARKYRQKAWQCLEQSRSMASDEARAILSDLAGHWTRLAEQSERQDSWPVSEMPDATVLIMRRK